MSTKFSKLVVGSVVSEIQFSKVVKIVGDQVQLDNGSGTPVILHKSYVESFLQTADQYTEEVKINRTEMQHILLNSPRVAVSLSFNKQVKPEDVHKEAMASYSTSTPAQFDKNLKKAIKDGMAGEERIIVGHHEGKIDTNGRLIFQDMNLDPAKDAMQGKRPVDPRTLNWVITGNKKYTLK